MKRLAELEGRWQVVRTIDDRRAGLLGRFTGETRWVADPDGLVQVEEGTLIYGNAAPMQATRRYLWREDPSGLQVFFDDGRPFHTVPSDGAEAVHVCPPDTYRVRYMFEAPGHFATQWHVTGPRKDAILNTRFEKL